MTFKNNLLEYRVMFDLANNLFIVLDKNDEAKSASGITIEQAVRALKKFA
ncbi:hypothetical protein [Enterococcus timonensis]|nr:hypothetical protein [Enterococcus timonensis]